MKNIFTYSILQYKPSLLSGEVLNVGLLFFFYEEKKISFVYDDTNRIKTVFHKFDRALYNGIVQEISTKTQPNYIPFFLNFPSPNEVQEYIWNEFLSENASSLQFTEPVNSVRISDNIEKIIQDFTNLFLPYYANFKEPLVKKDEGYIIKEFNDFLHKKDNSIDNKIARNSVIKTNKVEVSFDYEWENKKTHLVKAISFDLREKSRIQNKIILNGALFNRLADYAVKNNKIFDILTVAPQDENLIDYYYDTLDLLKPAPEVINIWQEQQLDDYATKTVKSIQEHYNETHSDN